AVFAGGNDSFYLTNDGDLYAMGQNGSAELGLGHEGIVWTPRLTRSGGVAKVVTTGGATLAIDSQGGLFGVGENAGSLGLPLSETFKIPYSTELHPIADGIRSAKASSMRILYVDGAQQLWGLGYFDSGE